LLATTDLLADHLLADHLLPLLLVIIRLLPSAYFSRNNFLIGFVNLKKRFIISNSRKVSGEKGQENNEVLAG
jgi:hypothetical protein